MLPVISLHGRPPHCHYPLVASHLDGPMPSPAWTCEQLSFPLFFSLPSLPFLSAPRSTTKGARASVKATLMDPKECYRSSPDHVSLAASSSPPVPRACCIPRTSYCPPTGRRRLGQHRLLRGASVPPLPPTTATLRRGEARSLRVFHLATARTAGDATAMELSRGSRPPAGLGVLVGILVLMSHGENVPCEPISSARPAPVGPPPLARGTSSPPTSGARPRMPSVSRVSERALAGVASQVERWWEDDV